MHKSMIRKLCNKKKIKYIYMCKFISKTKVGNTNFILKYCHEDCLVAPSNLYLPLRGHREQTHPLPSVSISWR